jgi:hypothetical protein
MQQLKQIYRNNYSGENIITELNLSGGEWIPTTEYVENQVTNIHTTNQAVAIGNGESRLAFDLVHVANHKSGLFAENKLQSYGCNALYRDFAPDFLISTGDAIIEEIANSGYTANKIVYANAESILKYPGKFYLLPQNPHYDSGSLAAYMACFDGHKKVFMLGYDQYDENDNQEARINNIYKNTRGYLKSTDSQDSNFLTRSLLEVMRVYNDVEFVRVMPLDTYWIPEMLRSLANFRQIDYNAFIREADIG